MVPLMVERASITTDPLKGMILVNDQPIPTDEYFKYHRRRIGFTIEKLHEIGARKIVEVGSHPWVMTSQLIDDPQLQICATVSAEEITRWPDDIGVTTQPYRIRTALGNEGSFINYSANIERTLFDLKQNPDTVVACEIVEHLIRSPHVMFLNINHWLPKSGKLLVTSPNGAQFANPFRRKSLTPGYRCHVYERHSHVYTLDELTDLIQLCGFNVLQAGYCDVYDRYGPSSIYGLFSHVPLEYCRQKFMKTIYVVGEKQKHMAELEKPPRVYDARGNWEFISR